jgi:tetratricopeptide (TPR) repeat protein
VDDGVLAITVALTPKDNYKGGGTFMEHFVDVDVDPEDNEGHKHPQLIEMDVGHATLRPGSVRHGGHRVLEGERFVLGAFLLLEDRVEHVRRLKNRGAQLRSEGKLYEAIKHFEWGLALNPKCTTCLKDWAEILYVQRDYDGAEQKLRQALDLLEYKDSDALFTLGLVLSEQGGRDDDCIDMYRRSLALNGEDAELLYNLAIKIGDRHRRHTGGGAGSDGTSFTNDLKEELKLYVRCTKLDPNFGGAYLNLGTSLAEQGNLGDAETMFQKAASTPFQSDDDNSSREDSRGRDNREVIPKALVNLALIYHQRAGEALQHGQIPVAKSSTLEAIRYLDKARSMLEDLPSLESYRSQYRAIRLASHRNLGQIFAGSGDMISCEKEFRRITSEFPTELKGWQMLGRVLEVQGKHAEMQEVISKIHQLS